MKELQLENRKRVRAECIMRWLDRAGLPYKVACFSLGNAANELRRVGLDVVAVGPAETLYSDRWWDQALIKRFWPDRFDATCGHLPVELMMEIGEVLLRQAGPLQDETDYVVPTGSGETLLALKLARPSLRLTAQYNVSDVTRYADERVMIRVVECVADRIRGLDVPGHPYDDAWRNPRTQ